MHRMTGPSRLRCKLPSVALGRHLLGQDQDEEQSLPSGTWTKILLPLSRRRQKQKQRWPGWASLEHVPLRAPHTTGREGSLGGRPEVRTACGAFLVYCGTHTGWPTWSPMQLPDSGLCSDGRNRNQRPFPTLFSSDELCLDQAKHLVVDGLIIAWCRTPTHTQPRYLPNLTSPPDSAVVVILPHAADGAVHCREVAGERPN